MRIREIGPGSPFNDLSPKSRVPDIPNFSKSSRLRRDDDGIKSKARQERQGPSCELKDGIVKIKPLRPLTSILRGMLKVNIGLLAIAAAAGLVNAHTYFTLPAEVDPNETIFASDGLVAMVGGVQFMMAVVLGVTFLHWIYRINFNLRALSSVPMEFTPLFAIAWYFVPIANLFMPYRAMKEIWRVANRTRSTYDALLAWWWTLWIISTLLIEAAGFYSRGSEDSTSYMISALAYVASDSLDIILNFVAIALVTRIGRAYETNYIDHPNESPAGDAETRLIAEGPDGDRRS
jgi:hypothetical protein